MGADFANMQHLIKINKIVSCYGILLKYTENLHGRFVLKIKKGETLTKVFQKVVQKPV